MRVLAINDVSCVGKCSLTTALPIISACGVECNVLPTAILSTHTGGFTGYTFRDLTDDIPAICAHWQKQGISFDALYTGYLGSARQVEMVEQMMKTLVKDGGAKIVDPAMADNGKLYAGFDAAYVDAMRRLCRAADVILPNVTEAALLTGLPYREQYDENYIRTLLDGLADLGVQNIVLTGVSYANDTLGVLVCKDGETTYRPHRRIDRMFHGTGDVYASAFTGALMNGRTLVDSAEIAADYTLACIENTVDAPEHWYGVRFEPVLPRLIEMLK